VEHVGIPGATRTTAKRAVIFTDKTPKGISSQLFAPRREKLVALINTTGDAGLMGLLKGDIFPLQQLSELLRRLARQSSCCIPSRS
jgi:hypothetical protein